MTAKTEIGKKLIELRTNAISQGMKLISKEDIEGRMDIYPNGTVQDLHQKNTQLLTTLKRAVKVSEDLHDDYEYCREWQEVLDLMRKTIKECE